MKIEKSRIVEINITEDTLKLTLKNGEQVSIEAYHAQDYCERVYADWSILGLQGKSLMEEEFDNITIKGIEKMGFLLRFELDDTAMKVFVPCYNEQNGYYSSNLELKIKYKDEVETIDISNLVEDRID